MHELCLGSCARCNEEQQSMLRTSECPSGGKACYLKRVSRYCTAYVDRLRMLSRGSISSSQTEKKKSVSIKKASNIIWVIPSLLCPKLPYAYNEPTAPEFQTKTCLNSCPNL